MENVLNLLHYTILTSSTHNLIDMLPYENVGHPNRKWVPKTNNRCESTKKNLSGGGGQG